MSKLELLLIVAFKGRPFEIKDGKFYLCSEDKVHMIDCNLTLFNEETVLTKEFYKSTIEPMLYMMDNMMFPDRMTAYIKASKELATVLTK